jgi:hypothetical protein
VAMLEVAMLLPNLEVESTQVAHSGGFTILIVKKAMEQQVLTL